MPSLKELVEGSPNFNYYYGGPGNFTQNKIPFGNDRPGGGSSGEPYIAMPIGSQWSPSNFDDGIIRGGILGATTRTVADVGRITRFITNFPKGPLFVVKQIGLQLSNPRLEHKEDRTTNLPTTGQGFLNNAGNFISNTLNKIQNDIGPTRIYNLGANTISQVAVSAFGRNLVRHGLTPVMNEQDKYYFVVRENNKNGNNRLVKNLIRLSADKSENEPIDEYKGGAGSILGIGKTTIPRYDNTLLSTSRIINSFTPIPISDLYNINNNGQFAFMPHPDQSPDAFRYGHRLDESNISIDLRKEDFRKLKSVKYNADIAYTDYENLKIEKRIGVGSARGSDKSRSDYSVRDVDSEDKINMVSLFYADNPGNSLNTTDVNNNSITRQSLRDLIKFRIEAVDNDNPLYSIWMIFRAYITNINDSMKSTWDSYTYTGRGEIFYRYQNFKPSFSFDLMIAAHSRAEMKPLYQKLNFLKSQLAPDYNKGNKLRGSYVRLTVGDYMYRQPGFINDLDIQIDDDFPWEVALQEPENELGTGVDSNMHELPMILRCSISFTPIYDFLPRKSASTPFISGMLKRDGVNYDKDWLYTESKNGKERISLEQSLNDSKPKKQ